MSPLTQKKQKKLERVAEDNGVAVIVLDEEAREVAVSNNNSICRSLTSSDDFARKCGEYCGVAFQKTATGKDFEYVCYAGLTCKAMPVSDRGKRFVAIVGRTFTSAENYRQATDRAIAGDWDDFSANDFFENVLMNSSDVKIAKAMDELADYRIERAPDVLDLEAEAPLVSQTIVPLHPVATPKDSSGSAPAEIGDLTNFAGKNKTADPGVRASEAAALRSVQSRLSSLDYKSACELLLEHLDLEHSLKSVVWLESRDNQLVQLSATGAFKQTPIGIAIPSDNEPLLNAAETNVPLELKEQVPGHSKGGRTLYLFPTVVSGEIRGALGVEGRFSDEMARAITRLCRRVGPQLEILRLRHEVSSREWLGRATSRFTESLKRIDSDDFWTHVTQISAELVQSERASLLVQNDQSEGLRARASVGARVDLASVPQVGNRVSRIVLEHGKPIVVPDINQTRIKSAPSEWQYKTGSFISYPILIGNRRLAVMNFTDKASGAAFEARDIELLDAIAPQIAIAIDRTSLKDMAGEFEQLSVTDALTGLLNRRYLEKRLNEEIIRSKRHRFPMSVMMLDVDNFKGYNDAFGHPAGDAALKIVAGVLKDILRGADVAARYGGEEFAILLPQTTSAEAAVIAERLRQRIERTEFPKRKVTISIGIASSSNEIDTPENIIGAADHALYEAKNHGRNNVQVYEGYGKPFNENIH